MCQNFYVPFSALVAAKNFLYNWGTPFMSMQETIQFFLVIISEEYLQKITCNNYTCIYSVQLRMRLVLYCRLTLDFPIFQSVSCALSSILTQFSFESLMFCNDSHYDWWIKVLIQYYWWSMLWRPVKLLRGCSIKYKWSSLCLWIEMLSSYSLAQSQRSKVYTRNLPSSLSQPPPYQYTCIYVNTNSHSVCNDWAVYLPQLL